MKNYTAHYERAMIKTGKRQTFSFAVRARNYDEAESRALKHILKLYRINDKRPVGRLATYRFLYILED